VSKTTLAKKESRELLPKKAAASDAANDDVDADEAEETPSKREKRHKKKSRTAKVEDGSSGTKMTSQEEVNNDRRCGVRVNALSFVGQVVGIIRT
jgi:hypothetical protein